MKRLQSYLKCVRCISQRSFSKIIVSSTQISLINESLLVHKTKKSGCRSSFRDAEFVYVCVGRGCYYMLSS